MPDAFRTISIMFPNGIIFAADRVQKIADTADIEQSVRILREFSN